VKVVDKYSKNAQIRDFMKINQLTAEWHRADERTDRHDIGNSEFRILRNHQKWHPN